MQYLSLLASLFFGCASPQPSPNPSPNIVVIYMDDLGYGDIGPFGAQGYATPHLDQFAKEGTKFTSFYSAQAVCSASRCALLTGCYPNRVGLFGALGPNSKTGLAPEETTLAEICKQKNYATGIFGKWHLGDEKRFLPLNQGFDEYFGLPYSNDMTKKDHPKLPLISQNSLADADVDAADQDQLTTLYTEHAVDFIRRHKEQPFFLYLPHSMVHVPLHVSDKFRGKSGHGLFADVMMEVDWSVGQVMQALKDNGLDDKTLVVFSSDNGPWLSFGDHAGNAGPLREGKFTSWEGGVREPTLMRWPGHIPAGTTCDAPLMTIDLLPTVAKLIGAQLPERKIDGLDISAVITGKSSESPHEALYFYYHKNDLEALRSGKWKLEFARQYKSLTGPGGRVANAGKYIDTSISHHELYDLDADPGEKTDLAASHPEVVARLQKLAGKIRSELGDELTACKGSENRPAGKIDGPAEYPDSFPRH
jgi:arylsulfatase A